MKKYSLSLLAITAGLFFSCSGAKPVDVENVLQEREPCLEDILNIPDEDSLIAQYGKESVSYDTVWGAEGFFTVGTYLRTDEHTHIEILWSDSAKRAGVISATLVSDEDYYSDKLDPGKWKSCTGVAVGMSLEQVQKINGRPFKFSGFGWDYGGGIISWEDGTLEGKGMTLQISEGPGDYQLTEEENNQVLGDHAVMSDNPAAAKLEPRVWSVSVAKIH